MPNVPKRAFVFFNCDENKSEASMNIFYNRTIYRDMTTARRVLWKKIREEREAEKIFIDENDLSTVRTMILEGDPTAASNLIRFGAIKEVDCF